MITVRTPTVAEKKVKKSQSHKVVSPGSRPADGTPPSRIADPSTPTLQPKIPTAVATSKDSPSTPVGIKNITALSEERKPIQAASQSAKVNQPRRITLNTLEAWSKTPR